MDIKIVGPAYPESYLDADGTPRVRHFYSFEVDGVPSLKWFPECNVPGQPKEYYVQRCINRLLAGRSSEAFGSAPAVKVGDKVVQATDARPDWSAIDAQLEAAGFPPDLRAKAIAAMKAGRREGRGSVRQVAATAEPALAVVGDRAKPREAKPTWRYTLDGAESEQPFPSEQAARAACAVAAFMSRHKLGAIANVLAALKVAYPAGDCKVWACAKDHEIKASVDGKRLAIGWARVGDAWTAEKFKPMEMP